MANAFLFVVVGCCGWLLGLSGPAGAVVDGARILIPPRWGGSQGWLSRLVVESVRPRWGRDRDRDRGWL